MRMHRIWIVAAFIGMCSQRARSFLTPGNVMTRRSRWSSPADSPVVAMSSGYLGGESPDTPTSRGQVIAKAAAGLLAAIAVSGVPAVGAVTVPEALPACPSEGNCVSSTSFKLFMQGRYMAPWSYTEDSPDASAAYSKLLATIEKDPQLKIVDQDADKMYISAVARSAVPPDGTDTVEFLLKPADGLVSFRSKSTKNVYAGPVIVGDGGSNRNRLEALRKKLGWPEQGIDNYMREQGIDDGTKRAKGYLSELGWRQGETQSYGEEDEY